MVNESGNNLIEWIRKQEPSEEALSQIAVVLRGDILDERIWFKLSEEYLEWYLDQLAGGVKDGTHHTYLNNAKDLWKTTRRLGIDDALLFSLPTISDILIVWIVDCNKIRNPPNTYTTIRGKMRAWDYFAQLCRVQQDWKQNLSLIPCLAYSRRTNPGKGSDTLPVTRDIFKSILNVAYQMVTKGAVIDKMEEPRRQKWMSLHAIRHDQRRWKQYGWIVGVLLVQCTGARGCEVFPNADKNYKDYGVRMKHIKPTLSQSTNKLKYLEIELPNSKTARANQSVSLIIGVTQRSLEPAVIVYDFWKTRKYKGAKDEDFLFQWKLDTVKKHWQKVVKGAVTCEPERYKFHGTRKGFATQLLKCGIPMSLIAYAGRWQMREAIFDYLIHTKKDLLPLTKIYFYGEIKEGWDNPVVPFKKATADLQRQMNRLSL